MIYYIFIISFLIAFFIYLYLYFIRTYYTNVALMKFRELKYKSILFLAANIENQTSLSELEANNSLLEKINASIKHFGVVKQEFTKYKFVKSIYSNIDYSSKKYNEINEENFKSVEEFKIEFAHAISILFKTIPFFRQRLILHFFILILKLLVKLGFVALKNTLRRYQKLYIIEKDMLDNNGCFN